MTVQFELFPVQNPCRDVCQTDARGYCIGCFRSRDERFNWNSYSDAQKRNVLKLCHQRKIRKNRTQIAAERDEPNQPDLF